MWRVTNTRTGLVYSRKPLSIKIICKCGLTKTETVNTSTWRVNYTCARCDKEE